MGSNPAAFFPILVVVQKAADPRLEPVLDVPLVLGPPLRVDEDLLHALVQGSTPGPDEFPSALEERFDLAVVELGGEVGGRGFDDGSHRQRARSEPLLGTR